MQWKFDGNAPIYTQLVDQMKLGIVSGEWIPGQRIPAVRELAVDAGVNPNTMQRALAQLENEGLVRTERTAGRYVTEDRALIEQLRAEAARNLTAEFLEKMRGIGYGPEQAATLLERWNEKEETNHD